MKLLGKIAIEFTDRELFRFAMMAILMNILCKERGCIGTQCFVLVHVEISMPRGKERLTKRE